MATIFALGKAAQAEACLKGTCRLRQRRPSRKALPPKGRGLFCHSAALRVENKTFQVLLSTRALRTWQNRSRHCTVNLWTAPYHRPQILCDGDAGRASTLAFNGAFRLLTDVVFQV